MDSIEKDKRIGGCLLSAFAGLVAVFVLLSWLLEGESSPQPARKATCASNLRQLGMGLSMYAMDFDDRLPPASSWSMAIVPYTKNPTLFQCPSRTDQAQGYAFNSRLSGAKVKSIKSPGRVPILFETTIDRANAADPLITFALPHSGSSNVAWLDGHVTAVKIAPGSYGE